MRAERLRAGDHASDTPIGGPGNNDLNSQRLARDGGAAQPARGERAEQRRRGRRHGVGSKSVARSWGE